MQSIAEDTQLQQGDAGPSREVEAVRCAWRRSFQKDEPETDAERGLHRRLVSLATEFDGDDAALQILLLRDVEAKSTYLDPTWGYVDASNIVSRVDDCIIALQEQSKRQFLDPLSWDLVPHKAVLVTVEAVLLLFGVPLAKAECEGDEIDGEDMWRAYWGLWIVKNIEAHAGGWEWVAHNEPTGLFTKPYALSAVHLDRVYELLGLAAKLAPPDIHHCWHHLPAYSALREWASACAAYLHMVEHCLPEFDGFAAAQKLVTPPQRTPKANVWFRCVTVDGIEYFYNRVHQFLTLKKPEDFDGALVDVNGGIPKVVRSLIDAALENDVATRVELERRGKQRVHAQLLDQDEWVECLDKHTQSTYYYSMRHYRVSPTPPEHGAFVSYRESVAFAAVLRLQAAYRRRRLDKKTQARKAKRTSLPTFGAFANRPRARA